MALLRATFAAFLGFSALPRAGADAQAAAQRSHDLDELHRDMQAIMDARAAAYNCSFSVAIKVPSLGAALQYATRDITPDTKFPWGSITKMWTGASIMQLVAQGELGLDEPAAPIVDALLASMKEGAWPSLPFQRLSDLFGAGVEAVTVRHLLSMRSGMPDFDTATPGANGTDTDPLRAEVYANKGRDYSVPLLIDEPWVAKGNLSFPPGVGFAYSSTNFELLGMILAQKKGLSDYRELNQSAFIPEALAHVQRDVQWANSGSPVDHGAIGGFDRTTYNGEDPNKTGGVFVGDVHGVFAGWSASNFVAPARAVAELGYALWAQNSSAIVPAKVRDAMLPDTSGPMPGRFYGLAAMNVGLFGVTGGLAAVGHLGATYGYDSITAYSPDLDVAVAVASNIETRTQSHPSDVFCAVFNRIRHFLEGTPAETCSFSQGSMIRKCDCHSPQAAVFV